MSIDKTGFKHRASNVVAWVGFIIPAVFWFFLILDAIGLNGKIIFEVYPRDLQELIAFGLYPCCAVINYLMVGKMRLLPWKDIE
jgi:hypothetical protein